MKFQYFYNYSTLFQNNLCMYGSSLQTTSNSNTTSLDWAQPSSQLVYKEHQKPETEDEDDKGCVAVYPWMTRVHSSNGKSFCLDGWRGGLRR